MVHPIETYLKHLAQIHATGGAVPETSYYGALGNLLNEVGKKLKPKVRCVPQLRNTGAGSPDFGLFTANQFQRAKDQEPPPDAIPERGVIEVKGWADDSFLTAKGTQVSKYWDRYGLVLVTNYRDFVLIGRDDRGKPVRLETHRLADSESAFRDMIAHPRKTAAEQGDRLAEFLRRVMLHAAPLTAPEDLARFLASYACEARCRVEDAADLPTLAGLKKGLEEALGMKFEGDKGEHFFRATLVQTLFYGVFSSWVLWARKHPAPDERFNWHEAGWTLHVPMIASLFSQIATPQKLKPLGVDEVLDWAGAVLNRVDRGAFFQKFEEEHAVQYFYEPFLDAYDPDLRKALGVWYTPPEIVKYQVERVDRVLREELGVPDGLADDQVVILDPCCGTGAYLVETLRRIHTTLKDKGGDALVAQRLKKAAIERVFGFEILPAPFVVSHLQIGLMLRLLGAALDPASDERAGVYLTNALTGWEPPKAPKTKIAEATARTIEDAKGVRDAETIEIPGMPELVQEAMAARAVKRDKKILVILGNPPYNAFAGTSPEEEGGLVEPYKEGLTTPVKQGGWGIKKFNLDDLYVRFLRIAERRIAKSGRGVVCYISNYSWTSEPSFVVLRKRLLEAFDQFWVENMHGNRKISEYAPDGRTSETIFAIPGFSAGIQQGVVISLWVRRSDHVDRAGTFGKVFYRDDIDAAKAVDRRQQLLASLRLNNLNRKYERAQPSQSNRYSFRPSTVAEHYLEWPMIESLTDFKPSLGILENRKDSLINIDHEPLLEAMACYFDRKVTWDMLVRSNLGLTRKAARYDPERTREKVLSASQFVSTDLKKILVRPMDKRWCYYSSIRPLWNEPRPDYVAQCWEGNYCVATRRKGVARIEGSPFNFAPIIGAQHSLNTDAYYIPIRLRKDLEKSKANPKHDELFEHAAPEPRITGNLSETARTYLAQLRVSDPDRDAETAGLIWMHALAIGYAPAYLSENADGIRQDWPRIPLPSTKNALLDSAQQGRRVAALLDTEKPVDGVTAGKIDPRLKSIAVISKVGGGALDPAQGHLDLTAGWGHRGKGGICMPGKGKCEVRSQKDDKLKRAFGDETLDVYLNDTAYWANVPRPVWEFYIGGYQVIKKWLSYREKTMLGRGLKLEEAEYVTEMARRLAALILLQPDLDANYQVVKADTWPWPPSPLPCSPKPCAGNSEMKGDSHDE